MTFCVHIFHFFSSSLQRTVKIYSSAHFCLRPATYGMTLCLHPATVPFMQVTFLDPNNPPTPPPSPRHHHGFSAERDKVLSDRRVHNPWRRDSQREWRMALLLPFALGHWMLWQWASSPGPTDGHTSTHGSLTFKATANMEQKQNGVKRQMTERDGPVQCAAVRRAYMSTQRSSP